MTMPASTLSRRAFLRLTAAGLPLSTWPSLSAAQEIAAERRERIADVYRMYHLLGSHRTATEPDENTAQWLAGEASRRGAEVAPRRFPLNRVVLTASFVESGSVKREGVPFFDGGFTTAEGVLGTLGAPNSGAPIALVTLNQAAISSEGQSIAELRRSPGRRAIVAITNGGRPGLCPSNARSFLQPYGVPVVQVSSTASDWLNELAQSGREVRVVADARRAAATAENTVATVRGKRPDLAPVVVMTPRSGWWQCVSERGGGLACWLEIISAVALAKPDRTIRFIASSGHELGHLGLDAFLEEEKTLVKSAWAWLHLGANIGAAEGQMRLQSSADEIEALAVDAISKVGARLDVKLPRGAVPAGEARNIHVSGGRYVSLLGSGPHFHNPDDMWPQSVDLDAVTKYAEATVEIVLRLARQERA